MKVPPPPQVGARYFGPSRNERARRRGPFATVHHVRAVVDHERDPAWGHVYWVVLRYWSARKGWVYLLDRELAFTPLSEGQALYTLAQRRKGQS